MAFNAGSQGTMSQKGDGEAIAAACLSTLVSIKRGHLIMRGRGPKMSVFVYPQCIKTVHARGGRGKKSQSSVHVVVECPKKQNPNHKSSSGFSSQPLLSQVVHT
jgi:hypothetical protein